MSQNHTFNRSKKPYVKPTQPAKADANTDHSASTQNTSENGAKNFGTRSQTRLQYGNLTSFNSATSQNGGATVINVLDKAKAVLALSEELKDLEKLQLEVGEQMAKLVFDQMRLAEKCRIINHSMEALLK